MKGSTLILIIGVLGLAACSADKRPESMPEGWRRDVFKLPMLPMGLAYAEHLDWTIRRVSGRREMPTKFCGEELYMPYYPTMPEEDRVWYAISYAATTPLDGEKGCNFAHTTQQDGAAIKRALRRLTAKNWRDLAEAWGVEAKLVKRRALSAFLPDLVQ